MSSFFLQVALLSNVDNLRAQRNVPLNDRWALLQADHVMFVDGKRSVAMQGTGQHLPRDIP